MKNQQKGFIVPLLIIIIAALLIGGGVYEYQKNKQPVQTVVTTGTTNTTQTTSATTQTQVVATSTTNADWKTYNDSTLSISFKYPASWTVTPTVKSETNYNGDVLVPPNAAGTFNGVYISEIDCQSITQQHPGKITACQQIGNVAVYYGIPPNSQIDVAFDDITASISRNK